MKRKSVAGVITGLPVITFLFIILLISCGKTGPQGSTGPVGSTGAAGPAGPAGPQGPQGNANVLADTFSVTSSQWLWNSQYVFQTNPSSYTEYFTRYYDAAFPSLTQDILNTGMVLVFFTPNTSNNTNQWSPLPYQFTDGSGNFDYNIAFESKVGSVRLHYFFVQRNATATIPTLSNYTIATYKFKLVAVSGTIVSSMKKAHIDPADYNAVSHFVGF